MAVKPGLRPNTQNEREFGKYHDRSCFCPGQHCQNGLISVVVFDDFLEVLALFVQSIATVKDGLLHSTDPCDGCHQRWTVFKKCRLFCRRIRPAFNGLPSVVSLLLLPSFRDSRPFRLDTCRSWAACPVQFSSNQSECSLPLLAESLSRCALCS